MTLPALWQDSLDLYGQDGVKDACLRLQDEHGHTVTFVLWAIWAAANGVALPTDAVLGLLRGGRSVDDEIVQPLRQVRRRLPETMVDCSAKDQSTVKAAILAAELAAERTILDRLDAGTRAQLAILCPEQRIAANKSRLAKQYFTACGDCLETSTGMADDPRSKGAEALFDWLWQVRRAKETM